MRHRLCALAVVVLLCASACSDPEPQFADPTSDPPTTEPVSTPTSDPPTSTSTPNEGQEPASAFIRRWFAVSDEMQATGDGTVYRSLGPQCQVCAETADTIEGYYSAGGFVRFDGTTVRRVKRNGKIDGVVELDVTRSSGLTEYKASANSELQRFEGGTNTLRMRIERSSDSWVVLDYSILTS